MLLCFDVIQKHQGICLKKHHDITLLHVTNTVHLSSVKCFLTSKTKAEVQKESESETYSVFKPRLEYQSGIQMMVN